ncbi:hypothetical protein GCM10009765_79630 [Fodinicola feengrottensis]|uniref:Uncharacterized protein n=1 Tax=Fodinicola feengrottensis TaxID=435914 RepID=A0ABN2J774_9ACTN
MPGLVVDAVELRASAGGAHQDVHEFSGPVGVATVHGVEDRSHLAARVREIDSVPRLDRGAVTGGRQRVANGLGELVTLWGGVRTALPGSVGQRVYERDGHLEERRYVTIEHHLTGHSFAL